MGTTRKYWKGIEDLQDDPKFLDRAANEFPAETTVDEFLSDEKVQKAGTNRRDFLKFLGFSVTAATIAACETPVIKSIPYVNKPEEITPGIANWYASTYYDGNDFANVLVKTREGRPIYIKGNYMSPITGGAVNARVNSSVIALYDDARLTGPLATSKGPNGGETHWREIDEAMQTALSKGGKIRLLSNTIISPSTKAVIAELATAAGGTYDAGNTLQPDPAAVDSTLADVVVDAILPDSTAIATPATADTDFMHVVYDSISYSGMRKANDASFGVDGLPTYNFDQADVIVSINADFLSTWLMSTAYTKAYGSRRKPGEGMSDHWQFETVLSTTGSNADHRGPIKPSEEGKVAAAILKGLGGNISCAADLDGLNQAKVDACVEKLKAAKGKSLVVAGTNNMGVQVIVNKINSILGNYGTTIDLDNPIALKQGNDESVMTLLDELEAGSVDTLIVYGANPVYSHPEGARFAAAIAGVDTSISFASVYNETAQSCKMVAPDHHYLESWNDFAATDSYVSLSQPTIKQLFNTRQAQDSMLVWASNPMSYVDFMKNAWATGMHSKQGQYADVADFWNYAVHDGGFDFGMKTASAKDHNDGALAEAGKHVDALAARSGGLEVALYLKTGAMDGSLAANPFLQELPDPVTKVTWDNYITMNPADMKGDGNEDAWFSGTEYNIIVDEQRHATVATLTKGDMTVSLPVYASPGQKIGTIGVALGYGRSGGPENIGKAAYLYGRYGDILKENDAPLAVGTNVAHFAEMVNGTWAYSAVVSMAKTEETYPLACTQSHHTMMGRDSVVREATLTEFKDGDKNDWNPPHVLPYHEGHDVVDTPLEEIDLWDAHPVEEIGHRWGLAIDLSTCIGCGSCVTACNSENNVAVVGKDEVLRSRDMHWMRIDRYFSTDEDDKYFRNKYQDPSVDFSYAEMEKPESNPRVTFVPLMCQHCNHAPCETVCPVAATTHSNEGLNQMTYNRCIGTRYCANNCPFKVRRFNWFNYTNDDRFAGFNPAQSELTRMVLNPDVTVRARGVMEKCSLCVQSIQAGKLQAKKEGRLVKDGDIETACASSCPTNAITFGDYNDKGSKIALAEVDARQYYMLEEVGVKPNISYMVKVRNSDRSRFNDTEGENSVKASTGENV